MMLIRHGTPLVGPVTARVEAARAPCALPLADGVIELDGFAETDVDAAWTGEDDQFVRRTGLPGPFTRRDIADRVHAWQRRWLPDGRGCSFAIRETFTRRLVGGCVLEARPGALATAELAYWIYPPYRRRGYATRAVRLVCRYAFETLGVARLELHIEPANQVSLRVASRAGFVRCRQRDRRPLPGTVLLAADRRLSGRSATPTAMTAYAAALRACAEPLRAAVGSEVARPPA